MAVIVHVPDPQTLLDAIRAAARAGKFSTWSMDADGDFTHSAEQWKLKAWFRPKVSEGRIIFSILTPQKKDMTKGIYAAYHGHFIELLLIHFDAQFQRAEATALPVEGDQVRG
jgi:hypothetical protein